MMQPAYILSSAAISPQHSFEPAQFLNPVVSTADRKLYVVDADYRQFINPVAIRRMSRQMKMGISTGMRALQLAGVERPDAIITGTGLGSMTDMEHFLKDMIYLKEEALNPTYFIQSTYNSINGWIALQCKSTGYNQTYVNRGLSLELSLLDAQMFLSESAERKVALAGCFDEMTPDYFIVKSKCGYWKESIPDSLQLLRYHDTPGTLAGEGTAFFALSNQPGQAVGALRELRLIQSPEPDQMASEIGGLLQRHNLRAEDIDVVIAGMSGDVRFRQLYDAAFTAVADNSTIAAFKHLCGEYPTASGFALWLATRMLETGAVPQEVIFRQGMQSPLRNILIINHYILGTASLMLVTRP